jgi:DNA-binding transcriptional ArsR family regulator
LSRQLRTVPHPAAEELTLPSVLHALSDPARLEIVQGLASGEEQPCGVLAPSISSKSTLSHHLKVLRECGLTATRVNGTRRLVSLRKADLESRFPGLLDCVLSDSKAA